LAAMRGSAKLQTCLEALQIYGLQRHCLRLLIEGIATNSTTRKAEECGEYHPYHFTFAPK
jgi:hypothetical protein